MADTLLPRTGNRRCNLWAFSPRNRVQFHVPKSYFIRFQCFKFSLQGTQEWEDHFKSTNWAWDLHRCLVFFFFMRRNFSSLMPPYYIIWLGKAPAKYFSQNFEAVKIFKSSTSMHTEVWGNFLSFTSILCRAIMCKRERHKIWETMLKYGNP